MLGFAWVGIDPAGAVDWQVLYRLSESLRASDNIQLRADPEGPGFSSNTTSGLTLTGRTPTMTWNTTGRLGHLWFFGEDIPQQTQRTTASASSRLVKRTRSTVYNLSARYSQAPARRTVFFDPRFPDPDFPDLEVPDPDQDPEFPDPDPDPEPDPEPDPDPEEPDPDPEDPEIPDPVSPVPGLTDIEVELLDFNRISYSVAGGLVHRRTRTDVFSLNGSVNRNDFTGDAGSATARTNMVLSGAWSKTLTPGMTGRAFASMRHLSTDDEDDLDRLIYNLGLSSTIRPTRALSAAFNAGASITEVIGEDVTFGFRGAVSLNYTYRPWRDTRLNFSLSQRLSSSGGDDELRTPQSANASLSYRINDLSSLSLSGTFSSSSAVGLGGDARQAWRVSPSYRLTLARDWNLALNYQWVMTENAQANTAWLTLSHRGTLLP